MNKSPRLFSAEQAAEQLNCSRATIFAEIKRGKLVARRMGRRTLIADEDLAAYVAALPVREALTPPLRVNELKRKAAEACA
jgi:excisionase family DNA binding protein